MVQGVLSTRSRRGLAVLAAAVVLAGGTITTLAAWNEQERFQQTLGTAKFHLEASVDGGSTWIGVNGSTPGSLTFKLPSGSDATLKLVPGLTSNSLVQLRAAAGSLGADVNLSSTAVQSSTDATLVNFLSFSASGTPAGSANPITAATCQAGSDPAGVVALAPSGTLFGDPVTAGALTVPPAVSTTQEGPAVSICLHVAVAPPTTPGLTNALSGASLVPLWTFVASSRS